MAGSGYSGKFSVSYKNNAFRLVERYDGHVDTMRFSSPEELFWEIDGALNFGVHGGRSYRLDITRRAGKRLGKWADAAEGDVEAANVLNFPLKTFGLGYYPDGVYTVESINLFSPPTKESEGAPFREIGVPSRDGTHIDITGPIKEELVEMLFPNAVDV